MRVYLIPPPKLLGRFNCPRLNFSSAFLKPKRCNSQLICSSPHESPAYFQSFEPAPLDMYQGSPDGPGTDARYYDGTPFKAGASVMEHEEEAIVAFIKKHI
ncbi:MAG: hypothetical protein ACI9KK_002683 [Ascidiaceihabitans sp.]|jgi:hypothetical protein